MHLLASFQLVEEGHHHHLIVGMNLGGLHGRG